MRQRTMKRLVLLALLCCLVVSLAVTASAEQYKGSCGMYAKWTLDTDTGVLHITGTGEMTTHSWSEHASKITTVVIDEGITNVCDNAFRDCRNVTSVTLPEGIESLGEEAFYYCAITEIELPSTLQEIGYHAFHANPLKSIEIPGSVHTVGDGAFAYCRKMTELIIQEGVEVLDKFCFGECDSLTSVVMPDSVVELGSSMLEQCDKLVSVEFSDRITEIPSYCLRQCHKLERVVLPEDLQIINRSAFYDTEALKGIVLPEGVHTIADSAFANSGLEQLILPESVESVGILDTLDRATLRCNNLKRIAVLNPDVKIARGDSLGVAGITTVYCYPESTAHNFAVKYGYDFEFITEDNLWTDTTPIVNPFEDVKDNSWFKDYVLWAVDNDITTGTTATTFSPNSDCTRKQVVTFLWRAAGEPAPSSMENPFADVKEGDYFYTAVLWAVEEGITNGVEANSFGPNQPCTRGQVVTFLHRYCGEPSVLVENNPFADVGNSYYRTPVLWAVENGITTGMSEGVFAPGATCTRAQIVTFLYRCETGNP